MAAAAPATAAAAPDHVSRIYEAFSKLADAKEDAGKEKAAFENMIDAVKGDSKVKQLAAQYIPRFFKYFPDLAERALNAQLDLCEDPELAVRVHAIRSLHDLCKGSPVHTQRIADVLGQLLVAEDHTELATVKRTLGYLFEIDARASFAALLNQIREGEEPSRGKAIEFFKVQLAATKAVLEKTPELQKDVAANIKKILVHQSGVTGLEFKYFLSVLQGMKSIREDASFPGEIAAIIIKQANLDNKFDPANEEFVTQFISCLHTAQPLFRKKKSDEKSAAAAATADATPFVDYFFKKVLPVLDTVPEKSRLNFLRAITDQVRFVTPEYAAQVFVPVFEAVKKYVPKAAAPAGGEATKINYFNVECLLLMFQTLAFKNPALMRTACGVFVPSGQPTDFVSADVSAKKEDLQARFTYLAASAKAYSEQCATAAKNLTETVKKEKDEKEKKTLYEKRVAVVMANRSAQNSVVLANNFFAKIPVFGTAGVNPSWKPAQKKAKAAAAGGGAAAGKGGAKPKASGDSQGSKRKREPKAGDKKDQKAGGQQQQQKKAKGGGNAAAAGGGGNRPAKKQRQNDAPRAKSPNSGRGGRGGGGGRAQSKSPRGGRNGGGGGGGGNNNGRQQSKSPRGRGGRGGGRGRGGRGRGQ